MGVKSSSTVFRALRCLAADTTPTSAADLAGRLAVPVTTAARVLATLEAAGYAERQHGVPRFVLGKSARTLAYAFMAQFPLRDLAMPYLQQLTLETGLTSSLFVRLGWFALRMGRILGPSVLIHQTSLGEAVPLGAGAPSHAILAHLPAAERDHAFGSGAVDDTPALREACATILAHGAATAPTVSDPGSFDVAVPLLDRDGRVVGSVAVEGAQEGAVAGLADPGGTVRGIMRELAAKIGREQAADLAHYDHIDPDVIRF